MLQTALIALLVFAFRGQRLLLLLFLALYPALLYGLMSGHAPGDLLWSLQSLNVPIVVSAKVSLRLLLANRLPDNAPCPTLKHPLFLKISGYGHYCEVSWLASSAVSHLACIYVVTEPL